MVKTCGYIKLNDKAFKAFDPNAKVEPIKSAPAAQTKGTAGCPPGSSLALQLRADQVAEEEVGAAEAEV